MDKEGNLNGEFKEKLFTIDMVESCLVNGVLTIPKNINVLDTSIIKNLDDFGVKEIKFEKGSELTSVIGPINLEVDGDGIYLQKLEKVDFSNCQQLKSLDNCAFYKCHNLREVNFSNCANLEIVNHWIFACDRGLQKVDFSNCNKLKKFGESCFEGCKNLEFFDFNALESLEELGEFSFGQCMKFKNIDFANNRTIKIVGRGCFVCCYGAEKIDFSNSVIEKIGHNAFGYSNVKELNLSNCNHLKTFCNFYQDVSKPIGVLDLRGTTNIHDFNLVDDNLMYFDEVRLNYDCVGGGSSAKFNEAFGKDTKIKVYDKDKVSLEFDCDDKVYGNYRVLSLGLLKLARSKGFDVNADFLNVFRSKDELNIALKNLDGCGKLISVNMLKGIESVNEEQKAECLKLLRILGCFGFGNGDKKANKAELEVYKNLLAKDLIKHKIKVDIKGETNKEYINKLLQEKTNKIARAYSLEKLVQLFICNNIIDNPHKEKLYSLVGLMQDKEVINIKFAEFFVSNFDNIMNTKVANFTVGDINEDFDNENEIGLDGIYNNFESLLENSNKVVITRQNKQRFTLQDCEYSIIYKNVNDGNGELARLCGMAHIEQEDFEKLQELYEKGKAIKDEQVLKIEKDNSNSDITYTFIEKDNPLGLVLGNITNCCQRIGDGGYSCVEVGQTNVNSGFVSFNYKGKVIGQAWVWYDESTKTVALDNIEVPDVFYNLVNKEKMEEVKACIVRLCDNIVKTMGQNGYDIQNVIIGSANTDIEFLESDYYKEMDKSKFILMPFTDDKKLIYSDVSKEGQYIIYKNGKQHKMLIEMKNAKNEKVK